MEGTITKWLKREGDAIRELEPLVEINTDKVDTEIPAPAAGRLLKVYVGEGATVKAGTLLAVIGREEEAIPVAEEAALTSISNQEKGGAAQVEFEAGPGNGREVGFISPVVAKVAAEQGVDLSLVKGTGLGGRITKKDVLSFVGAQLGGTAMGGAPAWERPGRGRPVSAQ